MDRREVGVILKAAERLDDLTKAKGRRNGALGYTGLKVLKALLSLVDFSHRPAGAILRCNLRKDQAQHQRGSSSSEAARGERLPRHSTAL
jgi:hypothetical protein